MAEAKDPPIIFGRGLPAHLYPSNRLATVHERYRQTGQRSGSIGRTVLQTVAQKRFALCYRTDVMSVLSVLSVCNVRALWPNGWTDQDEQVGLGQRLLEDLWPRPKIGLGPGHSVRWGSSSSHGKGHGNPRIRITGAGFACVHIICGPCLL